MQRNVVNEVLVALIVVVMLLSGAVFAALMSIVSAAPAPTMTVIAADATPTVTSTLSTASSNDTQTPTASPTLQAVITLQAITSTLPPTTTPTNTATATSTSTPTATATVTRSPTITPSPTEVCTIPERWQAYTVQSNETWVAIGATIARDGRQLAQDNCRDPDATLSPGETIYLPFLPPGEIREVLLDRCNQPAAQILSPRLLTTLDGTTTVIGIVDVDNLINYFVFLQRITGELIATVGSGTDPVRLGQLAQFDASTLDPGTYRLRLLVERSAGRALTCDIPVVVE